MIIRSCRETDRLRCRTRAGALSRLEAHVRVRADQEPADRDAVAGLPVTPASGVGAMHSELRLGASLGTYQRPGRADAVAVQIHGTRRQLPIERTRRLELRAFRDQSAGKPVVTSAQSGLD